MNVGLWRLLQCSVGSLALLAAHPVWARELPPPLPSGAEYLVFDNGKWEFVAYSTAFGGLMGAQVGIATEEEDGNRTLGGVLLGTGAGLGISLLGTQKGYMASGRAGLFRLTTIWGDTLGLETAFISGGNERQIAWGGAGGGLAGTLAWFALSDRSDLTSGQTALLQTTYVWGSALGFMLGGAVIGIDQPDDISDKDKREERALKQTVAVAAVAGNAALIGLSTWAPGIRISRRRVYWLDLGASLGTLSGLGAGFFFGSSDRGLLLLSAVGTVTGVGVAYSVSDETDRIQLPKELYASGNANRFARAMIPLRPGVYLPPMRITW